MSDIRYAKQGGPPDNWRALRIFAGSREIKDVYEVNVDEGWALIIDRDHKGAIIYDGDTVRARKIESAHLRIEVRT